MDEIATTTLTGPLTGGESDATVTLRPMLTGEISVPEEFFNCRPGPIGKIKGLGLAGGGTGRVWAPIPAFLIEHPTAGLVLVDTGVHPAIVHDPSAILGRLGTAVYRVRASAEQPVPVRLRALGIDSREIKTIVLTHLHWDHAAAVSEFPAATFVVSGTEWDSAHQSRGFARGYIKRLFDHAFDYRLVDYDAATISSFATFGRSFDLFGDGSIVLVSTPGHSAGHQSVVVRVPGREILLCGDAAYTREAIETDVKPVVIEDEHNYRRSIKELRAYAELTPSSLIIPSHDRETWSRLDELYT